MAMPVLPHFISIIQRPRQGTAVLARYVAYKYKHRLVNIGGFESASCTIKASPAESENALDNYIGCVVQIHVDDPVIPVWEGYISRITYRDGSLIRTRSLDEMGNRVNVTFYDADFAGVQTQQTTFLSNSESQAIYGVKDMALDAGIHYNVADKSHKTVLRSTVRTQRAWPMRSTVVGAGNGELELEMRGLYDMAWNWNNYAWYSADIVSAFNALGSALVNTNIVTPPPNAPFIYLTTTLILTGTAYKDFQANTAFNIDRRSQSGQTYWQYAQSICEAGDGVVPWILGISTIDPNLNNRFVYHRPANATPKYTLTRLDPRLRDLTGIVVPPYRVTPDGGLLFTDLLPGIYTDGNDPSYAYISIVEYDADTQTVTVQSPDGLTMNAVYRRMQYFRGHGQGAFGAPVRNVL